MNKELETIFKKFEGAVKNMRTAQKAYFKYREPSALARAKQTEKTVDDWLDRLKHIEAGQQDLF